MSGPEHGGHLMHFDDMPQHHQTSHSPEATLSEPATIHSAADLSYQLDLSSTGMYPDKFGYDDGTGDGGGGGGFHDEHHHLSLQMDEITSDGRVARLVGGPDAAGSSRDHDPFGDIPEDFLDLYTNGGLGFGQGGDY